MLTRTFAEASRPISGEEMPPDIRANILRNAQGYLGVRETGDNRGHYVEIFLRSAQAERLPTGTAAPAGSSWCAGFVSHVLQNAAPGTVEYSTLARGLMQQAIEKDAYFQIGSRTPRPGDLIFFARGEPGSWKGHVGIVERVDPNGTIHTIEGNKPDYERPERPDGVGRYSYRQEEFSTARILGFGDIEIMARNSNDLTPAAVERVSANPRIPSSSFSLG